MWQFSSQDESRGTGTGAVVKCASACCIAVLSEAAVKARREASGQAAKEGRAGCSFFVPHAPPS
jgi:hypothetical protein